MEILFYPIAKNADKIVVGTYSGIVQKIALRATTILTSDNIEVIVPNSDFISKNVVNLSLSTQGVLKDPAPAVLFDSIEREQVTIYLKVATVTYADKTASLKSELNFSVFQKLQENVFTPEQMHRSMEKKSEMVVKPGQTNISINTQK